LVDEVLERFWFRSVDEVRSVVESWAGHSFAEIHSRVALCIIFADFTAAERANTADRVLAQVEPESTALPPRLLEANEVAGTLRKTAEAARAHGIPVSHAISLVRAGYAAPAGVQS
jgi:hypothetical protein